MGGCIGDSLAGSPVHPPCRFALPAVAYRVDNGVSIDHVDTMDFRTAANILGAQITTADIAQALDMSPHSIRQARLQEGAPGYRKPPDGWQKVLVRLAKERSRELKALIEALERGSA